jgi:hypothetical protein
MHVFVLISLQKWNYSSERRKFSHLFIVSSECYMVQVYPKFGFLKQNTNKELQNSHFFSILCKLKLLVDVPFW